MADTGGLDVTQTRQCAWSVKWGATGSQFDFGATDKVTVNLVVKKEPIVLPSLGNIVVGRRIIGLDDGSSVTVLVRQVTAALFQKAIPWYTAGAVSLVPATINADEYQYANLLTLHPSDVDAGTATEDLNLVKAVPVIQWPERTGTAADVVPIVFSLYPDRAQLPTRVYGYMGAVP
jgi:hypothetical protein